MQYLLIICIDPEGEPEAPSDMPIDDWVEMADARGRLFGDRIRPSSDAITVRKRGDELLVTDGPFIESREWIAGIDIIDVDNLDEAIDIAAKHPMARGGRVEIRPFWQGD